MPIRVLNDLPAVSFLGKENIFITSSCASIQEIRPLRLLLLNLMPKKIETENQFLRLLSNFPLQIDLQLLRIDDRISKNTSFSHLNSFYFKLEEVENDNFDGLIITGAPLGLVNFSNVVYWSKMERVLCWAKDHVTSILFVCWAVQAALKIFYGIPKQTRKKKLFGVYEHQTLKPYALLTRGFDDVFLAPHSRYADFSKKIIVDYTDLELLAESEETGVYLMASKDKKLVFVTGHPEYDLLTLFLEYKRDCISGLNPALPYNYFPKNNPMKLPRVTWRSHGNLLFSNWLNYYVYQMTPYDLQNINSV